MNPREATWLELNSEEGGNGNRLTAEKSAFPGDNAKWIDTSSVKCLLSSKGSVKNEYDSKKVLGEK